jgi:hypothetical protein
MPSLDPIYDHVSAGDVDFRYVCAVQSLCAFLSTSFRCPPRGLDILGDTCYAWAVAACRLDAGVTSSTRNGPHQVTVLGAKPAVARWIALASSSFAGGTVNETTCHLKPHRQPSQSCAVYLVCKSCVRGIQARLYWTCGVEPCHCAPSWPQDG